MHQDPDLDFTKDTYLDIKEGKRRVKYFFADPNVIIAPPEKDISLPTQDVCFNLDSTCLLYTSPSPRDRQKSRMPSSA